jgi:hypothetical protein
LPLKGLRLEQGGDGIAGKLRDLGGKQAENQPVLAGSAIVFSGRLLRRRL